MHHYLVPLVLLVFLSPLFADEPRAGNALQSLR
jgi:hypothetical protein